MIDIPRLNELSLSIEGICRPVEILRAAAPVNALEQKEKFLRAWRKGKAYHPKFSYIDFPGEWVRMLDAFLENLVTDDSILENALKKDVESTLRLAVAISENNPELITLATKERYGVPRDIDVERALEDLGLLIGADQIERNIPADVVAMHLRNTLEQLGLSAWEVILEDVMSARVSVRAPAERIMVRSDALFSKDEVTRLIYHEIGTHVFRYLNGASQPIHLMRIGFGDYLATEEGLANYHEVKFGVQLPSDRRRYAIRLLAAYYSLEHGFFEIFKKIVPHTCPDEAFDIVARVKRGIIDTSMPGGYLKDHVYHSGFLKITDYLKTRPDGYDILMSGKISLTFVDVFTKLKCEGVLGEVRYLPSMIECDLSVG